MLKRLLSVLLLLCLIISCIPLISAAQELPYAIKVNRALNTITVYTKDENGDYTVPYKAILCSTARSGYYTPLGSYKLESFRTPWRYMVDGTYAQYAVGFKGNYLFHSICYKDDSHDAMVRDSYNNLGNAASMGCVRMETADAKWIYDNCPGGTPVTIYEDYESPGPLGKPERTLDYMSEEVYNGWDPTDPAVGNPWHGQEVTELSLDYDCIALNAGETASLNAIASPETSPILFWKSSDESIAKVNSKGTVTALSKGAAIIEVSTFNGLTASCTVDITGELLPYEDLIPGQWYYSELRKAIENELFSGVSENKFDPNGSMTRAMAVQVLYNLEGRPSAGTAIPFEDIAEDAWYLDAVSWVRSMGMVTGISETEFCPDRAMTRQEFATLLWRYCKEPVLSADLTLFSDENEISDFALNAISWAVECGIMSGNSGMLHPLSPITRAEAAAVFCRLLLK